MGSTASDDAEEWDWVLSSRAENQFDQVAEETQERIVSKLDKVVSSEWRDPVITSNR